MTDARRAVGTGLMVVALLPAHAAPTVNGGVFDGGGGPASGAPLQLSALSVGQGIAGGPLTGAGGVLWPGAPLAGGAGLDSDGDGLSDALEAILGTGIGDPDTDDDGLDDFAEIALDGDPGAYRRGADSDPLNPDTDGDGLPDGRDPDPLNPPATAFTVPAQPFAAVLLLGLLLARVARRRIPPPRAG